MVIIVERCWWFFCEKWHFEWSVRSVGVVLLCCWKMIYFCVFLFFSAFQSDSPRRQSNLFSESKSKSSDPSHVETVRMKWKNTHTRRNKLEKKRCFCWFFVVVVVDDCLFFLFRDFWFGRSEKKSFSNWLLTVYYALIAMSLQLFFRISRTLPLFALIHRFERYTRIQLKFAAA